MSKKIDSYITFAYLSKKLVLGSSLLDLLSSNRVKLIILALDIGESQKKKFLDKAKFYNIPLIFYKTKDELADILHKGSVSCIAIKDTNLAKAILKEKESGLIDKEKK